jgi:hypothetical protein
MSAKVGGKSFALSFWGTYFIITIFGEINHRIEVVSTFML